MPAQYVFKPNYLIQCIQSHSLRPYQQLPQVGLQPHYLDQPLQFSVSFRTISFALMYHMHAHSNFWEFTRLPFLSSLLSSSLAYASSVGNRVAATAAVPLVSIPQLELSGTAAIMKFRLAARQHSPFLFSAYIQLNAGFSQPLTWRCKH